MIGETPAKAGEALTRALTSTSPSSVRRAKSLLLRITPFRDWLKDQPRSPEARNAYKRLVRELDAIVAGDRPDEITVVIRRASNLRSTD